MTDKTLSPAKVNQKRRKPSKGKLLALSAAGAVTLSTLGAEAELVEVTVRTITQLSDGSLQVTFQNGRSVIVPAGDWTIVNGRVFIEESAISQAGTSASSAGAIAGGGVDVFGVDVNPWLLAGGAGVAGLGLAVALTGDDDGATSASSTASSSTFKATGITASASVTNALDFTSDDFGQELDPSPDLSSLFEGQDGTLSYEISVTGPTGATRADLFYLDNGVIKILNDPTVDDNGAYTIRVTATDSDGGETATAQVVVEIDVVSEATATADAPIDQTLDHNADSGTAVIDNLNDFFQDAESAGGFEFSVSVADANGTVFPNVLTLSGTSLFLSEAITDAFVEGLTGSDTDEDIDLTVTVTARDGTDGAPLTQEFALTLDASANEAPTSTQSSFTLNGAAGESVVLSLGDFVSDVDGDTLAWDIVETTYDSWLSINSDGDLIGFVPDSGNTNGVITVTVDDGVNPLLNLSVLVDIA